RVVDVAVEIDVVGGVAPVGLDRLDDVAAGQGLKRLIVIRVRDARGDAEREEQLPLHRDSFHCGTSHSFTVLSSLPAAAGLPSGDIATHVIAPSWPISCVEVSA